MRRWGRTWKGGDPGRLSIPGTIGAGRGETPSGGLTVVTQAACPGVSQFNALALAGLPMTPVPHCYWHLVSTLDHKLQAQPHSTHPLGAGGVSQGARHCLGIT